jgi:hypothetical protein
MKADVSIFNLTASMASCQLILVNSLIWVVNFFSISGNLTDESLKKVHHDVNGE